MIVKKKAVIRVLVDIIMLILLLLTMAYHITDYKVHEWLGIALLVLFVAHNLLNDNWYKTLFKGRYTAVRVLYSVINSLLIVIMMIVIMTGILDSIWGCDFLDLNPGKIVWKLHLSSGILGFLLIAIHLGFHWGSVAALFRNKAVRNIFQFTAGLMSVYAGYAFITHKLGLRILMLARHTGLDFTHRSSFSLAIISPLCAFSPVSPITTLS